MLGTPSARSIARASARHPWRVIGLWLLALILAATAMTDLRLDSTASFTNKPESVRGRELLLQRFHSDNPAIETLIVRSETATVDDPAFQATVQEIVRRLTERPHLVDAVITYYHLKALGHPTAESMVSPDRHAMLVRVQMAGTVEQLSGHAEEYEVLVRELARPGFEVLSLGSITVHHEFNQVAESDLRRGEAIGLPIALLVLIAVFGALVAAGVPVILSIVSIIIALGLTTFIGRFVDLSLYVVNMITMIGLAIGIDYALFIISRYREERSKGLAVADAVGNAGATAGKAVLFSRMTVVLTLAGLVFLPTNIFRSLGAGAVVVVLVAMAAMLTLVPALLGLLGDRIDWPRLRGARALRRAAQPKQGVAPAGIGIWWRITRLIMARPLLSAAAAGLVLVGLALPSLDLRRGSALSTLPDGEVKRAYQALARDFPTGLLDPLEIALDGQRTPESEAAIARLVERMRQTPPFTPAVEVQWTTAGDLAVIRVPLAVDPASPEAIQAVRTLRGELIPAAFNGVPAQVYVTGSSAFNTDFLDLVDRFTPWIFAFVLSLSFILLLIAFRSIVIPAKAILLNLLSVGAAYGTLTIVFQKGIGNELLGFTHTPVIEAWVPIFLFCVLFGLSMDYHVFLLSRIQEHYLLTGSNREAVAAGLTATGRLISGAALIMIVVFAGFASGRLIVFQQLGFGLAVAVLLDATVIRTVLVPATMAVLGRFNWYLPAWLSWLLDLRIEGPRRLPAHEPALATGPSGE